VLSDKHVSIEVLEAREEKAYTGIALDSSHSPFMRRIIFLILVLTAFCALSANGSSAHSAKVHKKALPAASAHSKASAAAEEPTERPRAAASRRQPSVSQRSSRSAAGLTQMPLRSRRGSKPSRRASQSDPDSSPADDARQPEVRQASLLRTRFSMVSPLRGTYESLVRQNQKTEADGLERIEDDNDLNDRIARQMLVPVPVSAALTMNGSLPLNRRYCRPWTAVFLRDLGRAHNAQFHHSLFVSSAVRTVAFQKQLIQVNGNAASAEGDVASPHLTGATIDIAKQGMSRNELGWMRAWLLPLQEAGKIDVEEEFQQSCFHITVYKIYAPEAAVLKPLTVAVDGQSKTAFPVSRPDSAQASVSGEVKSAPALPEQAKTKSKKSVQAKPVPVAVANSRAVPKRSARSKRKSPSTVAPASSKRSPLRARQRRIHAE